MRKKSKRVIPGFGLSLGVTISILSIVVLIPLASLVIYTAKLSPAEFWETITRPRVLASFRVSLLTAFVASAINAVMGVILAWVLVRYRFPLKQLLNGMIELPFALPTAVAGIALTSLTADTGLVGKWFARFGISIAYTRAGITVALIFVGIPFVVRAVQPVLEKLDPTYEEAAGVMGASRVRIFWKVIFPEILPSALTGFGLAFGRCLGEYGSVVFIAGNQPYETEITPLIIMSKLQEYDYTSATSIALVMLAAAFLILFLTNLVQARSAKILKEVSEMHEETVGSKIVKWVLIGVSVLFLVLMLLLPLLTVISEALRDGWKTYQAAVTDKYTVKAVLLTLEATAIAVGFNTIFGIFAALAVTKFHFRGKKLLTTLIDVPVTISPVIAGLIFLLTFGRQSVIYPLLHDLGIRVVFAVPGIILATVFVTFPFVSRELIPVLESQGTDEEEAAALMGANAWTIFRKVTFPHIRWALLYGVVLCAARAMGEFGAVSVLSGHLRGRTNTLPLHVEILFNEFQYVPAFAVSSILVMMAIVILVIRSLIEHRGKRDI